MVEVPDGSIYFWMYTMGLKHADYTKIEDAVLAAGKQIREKDWQNYWNGFYRSDLYGSTSGSTFEIRPRLISECTAMVKEHRRYSDYPLHPYVGMPEIANRYIPCSANNKPMIKWGQGCLTLADAKAWPGQKYLAENTKGCRFIVVDCDGDHEADLDLETIDFLSQFKSMTHCLEKPKAICEYEGYEESGRDDCASFHLTFKVNRVIPTMHFPKAHIDIVGNKANSLRYFKNKKWNGLQPAEMTDEIWNKIREYIERRS